MVPTGQWRNSDEMSEIKNNNLHLLEKTDVPRCYFSRLDTEDVNLQLHYFRDASEAGYGTTSYLRIEYADSWHDSMCLCDREVTQRTHKD